MRLQFNFKYFVFLLVNIFALYNLIPFPLNVVINSFLCFLIVVIDKSFCKKLGIKFYFWLLCTITITFISLMFLMFKGLYFGLEKNLKAIVIGAYNFFYIFILYVEYSDLDFDFNIKFIFIFQLIVEGISFIRYINTYTVHRFHGTFPEPVVMGFWCGVCFFIVLLQFESKWKYIIALFLIYILYFHCKAKFALLAFPLAIFFALFYRITVSKRQNILLVLIFIVIIGLYALNSTYIIIKYLTFIKNHIEINATNTFVTRFFYLLEALQNLFINPFGVGFGLEYELYYPYFQPYIEIANNVGVDTSEISQYINPNTIIEKESISIISGHFGMVGILIYLAYFLKIRRQICKRKFLVNALMLYVFFESFFCITFYGNLVFIYAKIAINKYLNTSKIQPKGCYLC